MQLKYFFTLLLSALPLTLAADLGKNAITAPIAGDVITAGEPYTIEWTNREGTSVTLTLVDGPAGQVLPVQEIIRNTPNTGTYTWNVPENIPASDKYAIRITYNNIPTDYNYSDRFNFENENVVSSAAVSSSAQTSTAATSTGTESASSASTTEPETSSATTESEASSTAESTESEATTSAASSETGSVTSRATETTEATIGSSSTVSRATRTSPAVETNMAPVDQPSSASRSISGRSMIAAVAGTIIGGAFILL
ncbi:hypothetical protein TWF173_000786 [Orbilia oligospora]|uniref:Yeast cell wall synthesis Kre9/Knh1-like N-terminal domain-containing protein n=1 Tax=Arthrobotrys oligospora (strain ATCC 24927 / CBS 115.81 / DSM 1491) TaxID=756982 RepID=G1XDC7_ARTOA|nr:hypothetical protein AOL_s00079g312 [Orbilia oligospora ATCC 24927]EGX48673.1 hypothetical protein AOL_s00079g312 [Orbilia oligospora ATCC 24927]KAF3308720.1 hypothetical protein TWF173_000786 [Orbilia oligospora]